MKYNRIILFLLGMMSLIACKNFFKALRSQTVNVNKQHEQIVDVVRSGLYDSACVLVQTSKTLSMPRTELLKKMELARILFLAGKYEESAKLFIEAEYAIEDKRNFRYMDAFAGSAEIYNPFHPAYIGPFVNDLSNYGPRPFNAKDSMMMGTHSMQTDALYLDYNPNTLEKPLVNFYNGLNSIGLKDELWVVEAKRIGQLADILDQQQSAISLNLPYTPNPFLRLVEGLFYEAGGSLNDALISYENAYKDFENKNCSGYYGVQMSKQLQTDILSLNQKMGFNDKAGVWKKKLNDPAVSQPYVPSLILMIEEGSIRHKLAYPLLPPIDTVRTAAAENKGVAVRVNTAGVAMNVPVNGGQQMPQNYRVLYPRYQSNYVLSETQPIIPLSAVVCDKTKYQVNRILNLNYLAEQAYGKRYYYELMGHGSVYNSDYRQWLSLPASISYVRIPLVPNQKTYTLQLVANGRVIERVISVDNTSRSCIRHIYLPAF